MFRRALVDLGVLLLCVFCLASPSFADGVALEIGEVETLPEAVEQRAILWQTGEGWDLNIWPRFSTKGVQRVWVVPLPVKPSQIQLASTRLFEELDLLTTPTFVEVCQDYSCCCDGECDVSEGTLSIGDASSDVVLWQTGSVGNLDYVLLSATDGGSLLEWLGDEGYPLGQPMQQAIATLQTEGVYFFVASLAPEVLADAPFDPVRFSLDGLAQPVYPMRLTQQAISDQPLALLLWVVSPTDIGYAPSNLPHLGVEEALDYWPMFYIDECAYTSSPQPPEGYANALESYFQESGSVALMESASILARQHALFTCDVGSAGCFGPDGEPRYTPGCYRGLFGCGDGYGGSLAPQSGWSDELRPLEEQSLFVTRWNIRWSPEHAQEDLMLEAVPAQELSQSNVYCNDTNCPPYDCNCGSDDTGPRVEMDQGWVYSDFGSFPEPFPELVADAPAPADLGPPDNGSASNPDVKAQPEAPAASSGCSGSPLHPSLGPASLWPAGLLLLLVCLLLAGRKRVRSRR